jgi:hypothetical protein
MDQEAQQVIDQLRDAELAAKRLANILARDNYPAERIEKVSLAVGNIGAAIRILENAKYSKTSYTRTT